MKCKLENRQQLKNTKRQNTATNKCQIKIKKKYMKIKTNF